MLHRHAVVGGIQRLQDRRAIDYREDFFGKAAFLTVRPLSRASPKCTCGHCTRVTMQPLCEQGRQQRQGAGCCMVACLWTEAAGLLHSASS